MLIIWSGNNIWIIYFQKFSHVFFSTTVFPLITLKIVVLIKLVKKWSISWKGNNTTYFLKAMQCNNNKWIWYCEDHPYINHLDVSSHWQKLGYSHKTERKYLILRSILNWFRYGLLSVETNSKVTFTPITMPCPDMCCWML